MNGYLLTANDRKYGVPEQKKFPLPDADHVKSAIKFFNYVEPRYEKELAKAIIHRAKQYNVDLSEMNIGDNNRFKKYLPNDELKHHGIIGQKWGIRRYQNEDGSYTEAGKKRRNQFIERETRLSNKKWDRRLAKSEKQLQKLNKKGLKALQKGKLDKYKKIDDKYLEKQREHIMEQAYKAIESDKIKQMSLEDISKEKMLIGKNFIADALVSVGSIALSAAVGAPVAAVFYPNVGDIKTDNRISSEERQNIENSINRLSVKPYDKTI